jgi:glycosyltransferase involved in cell wall biosynthesis
MFSHTKKSYRRNTPLKLISIGSFTPVKNHLSLIEDLAGSKLDVELTLVGAGPMKAEYARLAADLGFTRRLIIWENLSHVELASVLPDFDIYIHYSLSEAFPRSILEAMAAALPVVATKVGFYEGEIVDGDNAILIASPDKEKLRSAVERLSHSSALRRRIGRAARGTVEEKFDWVPVFDRYRATIKAIQW